MTFDREFLLCRSFFRKFVASLIGRSAVRCSDAVVVPGVRLGKVFCSVRQFLRRSISMKAVVSESCCVFCCYGHSGNAFGREFLIGQVIFQRSVSMDAVVGGGCCVCCCCGLSSVAVGREFLIGGEIFRRAVSMNSVSASKTRLCENGSFECC